MMIACRVKGGRRGRGLLSVRPTQQLDLTTKESIPSPTKQSCQDNKSTNKTKMTAGQLRVVNPYTQ